MSTTTMSSTPIRAMVRPPWLTTMPLEESASTRASAPRMARSRLRPPEWILAIEAKSPTSSQSNWAGHHGEAAGGRGRLGHRVVDRDLLEVRPDAVDRRPRVAGSSQAAASSISPACSSGLLRAISSSSAIGAGDEHAGVPQVLAAGDVALGRVRGRASPRRSPRRWPTVPRRPSDGPPVWMYPNPIAGSVGRMPIVAMYPASARATASSTACRNRTVPLMTWSAANEPMMTSGSRSTRIAAASPIAAEESRGSLSRTTLWSCELRQLGLDRGAVRPSGDDHDAVGAGDRREPVPGVAQQRLAGAREVVQELRRVGAGQRPESGSDAAGRDDAVEALDRSHAAQTSGRPVSGTGRPLSRSREQSLDVEILRFPLRELGETKGIDLAHARRAVPACESPGRQTQPGRVVHASGHGRNPDSRHQARIPSGRNPVPGPRGHVVMGSASHHRRRHLLLPAGARPGHAL